MPHLVDLTVVQKLLDEERALILRKGFREKGHAVVGKLFGQPCPVCTTQARPGTEASHSAGAGDAKGGRRLRALGGGPVAKPAHSPAGQQDTATMASASNIDVHDSLPATTIVGPVP